jgi:DNA-binding PadR family transcriptional regulator
MTPNDIEVMLHCYISPEPHPRQDAPAVQDSLQRCLLKGLIVRKEEGPDDVYEVTEGGRLYIEALRNVPLPERVTVWRMPEPLVVAEEVKCQQ